ncbi:Winged helix DNA-binding domain-containing protein [Streptomyces sp. TLI_053]|uniref:winged helix DNA-binding domain-containing protein n=1 Tax=Streptomyces sp. TLI_053 TaxID=1855352 RepID=UPI00087BF83F|nr:winged helix DNA-binding domain-containing protein [Streptomyces sp. TLI_053]SDT75859.1 Winged helix DNA-binding domain-containing protein [Streptomyces sp. TLI_053]
MTSGGPVRIGDGQRRARLGRRLLLAPSARVARVEGAADAVVGLHASDPATVYLSACARLREPSAAEVERALYEDVSLVKLLSMRRTLFAVTEEFAPYVSAGAARPIAVKERATLLKHLGEFAEGWSEARLAETERAVLAVLAARGEATTAELGAEVPALRETMLMAAGKPYEAKQSVGSRLLRLLASDGHVRRSRPRGSWLSSSYPWAPVEQWPEVPAREAKAEVVRRWLARYGPGTVEDVKWWTGWTLGDVRRALADVGAVEVALPGGAAGGAAGGAVGLVLPGDEGEVAEPEPWAALLPGLDPAVMGWRGRDWYLRPEDVPALFDRAGNAGPTVWWCGRVVGGWAQRADGEVVWRLFGDVGAEAVAAVGVEAERLVGWLGEVRVTPRFRTPLERELVA